MVLQQSWVALLNTCTTDRCTGSYNGVCSCKQRRLQTDNASIHGVQFRNWITCTECPYVRHTRYRAIIMFPALKQNPGDYRFKDSHSAEILVTRRHITLVHTDFDQRRTKTIVPRYNNLIMAGIMAKSSGTAVLLNPDCCYYGWK
jgi:hypothetical protein